MSANKHLLKAIRLNEIRKLEQELAALQAATKKSASASPKSANRRVDLLRQKNR